MMAMQLKTGVAVALMLAQLDIARAATTNYGFSHHAFVAPHKSRSHTNNNNLGAFEPQRRRMLPSHSPWRQTHTTALASTPTKSNTSSNKTEQRNYNVLYQKVLRAPKSSSHAFLLDLVSYLQCVFELPGDLPMPYEITVPEDEEDEDGEYNPNDNRAVLIIDSPLSDDPCEACLEVEVIGIFPDNTDATTGPTMAMVALKKRKDPNAADGSGGGVAGGLFAASERSIVQALDRGLQDLEEGRVSIPEAKFDEDDVNNIDKFDVDDDDDGVDAAVKRIAYKNAIDAASTKSETQRDEQKVKKASPQKPISIERDALGNVVIDSAPLPETPPPQKKVRQEKKKAVAVKSPVVQSSTQSVPISSSTSQHQQKKQTTQSQDDDDNGSDYAIQMARQQAEAMMTTVRAGSTTSSTEGTVAISGGDGDFAVMAAKMAASRRNDADTTKKELEAKYSPMKGQESDDARNSGQPAKVASTNNVQKGKVQDLSKDEMFLKLQNIASKAKESSWEKTISRVKKGKDDEKSAELSDRVDQSKSTSPQPVQKMTKQVNIKQPSPAIKAKEDIIPQEKSDDEIQADVMQIAQDNDQVQQALKAATDMMNVDQEGEEGELSPEELLESILKFGEEKEEKEKPGYGFVEGAFGKAKDLLKNEDSVKELEFREGDPAMEDLRRQGEEEELKRIFAAGQLVAENRLSKPATRPSNLAKPSISEEDIDALIDADGTVPRNARVLDEELAELEVRMSRSQEEESDGPPQNQMFDIMSGPEVYNPNVDPETAVNWPGAKEGTRTGVQLAADLSTALKQARFALAVLTQMREEVDEDNEDEIRYFVGKKEISSERVTLLRICVDEAVKAGIIEDPEIMMAERSRLQMLIDELMSQPEERLEEIAMSYKDLLLSDNLVDLITERLQAMAERDVDARSEGHEDLYKQIHAGERAIMMNLAQIAQALVKETQALGAELEVSMLEIIRSICEVAMDPSHKTETDTAVALTDAVRDMRPLLDDAFVAYLKYAIDEEEGKLARAGLVDDPEHNRWLFVLKIVQEGVYSELSQGVERYIDHISYVLRMKSKIERKELLGKLIDVMPTMDVRPFVKVVGNIVSSLGTTVKGDFTDGVILGEMTNQLLQLQRDVNELLPPERVNELSKDADAWAATQRQRLLERRNLTKQRLEAARQTGDIDPDEVIKKPGVEAERFD